VTAPQADGADRISGTADSPLRASAAASGLAIVLLVGLLLRLTIAYVLLPGSGFATDIGAYAAWTQRLFEIGPGGFYAPGYFADYPPGYLYILWIGGHLLAPLKGGNIADVPADVLKLGPMIADVLIALVIYLLVRSWTAARRNSTRLGLIAAAIYLFNPITWYDSAVWGQTDAVGTLVLLLGMAALIRGNPEGASVATVLAALIKPQFGIVLAPVVAAVLIRRYLLQPGTAPRNPVLAPAPLRGWLSREQGPLRIVTSAAISLALLLALLAPFNLDLVSFLQLFVGTASGYPYLSVNAYNPWALLGAGGTQPLASGGGWSSDTVPFLGPLPAVVVGGVMLAAGFAAGFARAIWRDDRRSIVIVTAFLALAFFVLPTRVHERYMFPIFGLLPLLAVVDRRWLWATVVLSIGAFINLHGILTIPLYATPNLANMAFGELFRSPLGVLASVAFTMAGFAFICWQMRPAALREVDPFVPPVVRRLRRQVASPAPAPAPALAAVSASIQSDTEPDQVDAGPVPEAAVDEDLGPETERGPTVWQRLGAWLGTASIRRDRSALLVNETGGRLDRRDLFLVLLVFAGSLLLRTYRLEVPYGFHFDEVYHARTAIEFLQDWRYDMPHSIYEFTHPHVAKYMMALGIEALGDNQVTGVSDLGVPVKAAATETRWSPPDAPDERDGDRLYVVTDSDVRIYDLMTRGLVATFPGAFTSVAVDQGSHTLFLGEAGGAIWQLPTSELDQVRAVPSADLSIAPEPFAQAVGLSGDLARLVATDDRLVGVSGGGTLVSLDLASGAQTGKTTLVQPTAVAGIASRDVVTVDPTAVSDPAALAARLANLLGDDSSRIRGLLTTASGPIAVAGWIDKKADSIQSGIDDGSLAGVSLQNGSAVAVGTSSGIVLLDAESLGTLKSFPTQAPVGGLDVVTRGLDQPTIYAATGKELLTVRLPNDGTPSLGDSVPMPNSVTQVFFDSATTMVHVLGTTQDGTAPTIYVVEPTIYVVEPRGNSVFADARLSYQPVAVVLDVQQQRPAEDRNDLLAFSATGQLSTVDIGSNQFAFRFPGVLLGALMAACIYLLARFLFRRRSVALIVSLLVLADGMFFANARIAMNDTYVAFFIVAALTVFVPIWLGRWRNRWAVAGGLLLVGLLLGLALASKWVGLYAMGGVALLVLLRSALGRWIALLAMIGMTGLLGYIAITPNPTVTNPQINYPFLGLMVALTTALAIGIALRPVRLTRDELRLLVVGPIAVGLPLLAYGAYRLVAGSPPEVEGAFPPSRLAALGGAAIVLGVLVLAVAWWFGRRGRGPLASVPAETTDEPASPPPPRGWLRPGSGFLGLPWLLALGAILLIPLVVYVISYVPWIELGNRWTADFPPGHTGQTFLDLQKSMYDYHNFLRATHPASSPWWAWPFDLKPVWFEQTDYANGTIAVIYDTGNIVSFWLAIPAVAWVCWEAWRRRSLALTFLVVAIASLWLPWARIDRATFQYHIFTTLPFSFLALAYFLAELWHGPSPRTWMLARAAAALAVIGAPLLWLLRLPLCGIARTEQVNKGTEVCAQLSRQLTITDVQLVGLVLAVGGLAAAGVLFYAGLRATGERSVRRSLLLPVSFSVALLGVVIVALGAGLPGNPIIKAEVQAEEPALAALVLLAVPAYFVLRATDPRRFVVGVLSAAVVWFVVFYPNIASLPVPAPLSQIHLGLLPTWNWGFQFGVNLDEPNRAGPDLVGVTMLMVAVAVLATAAAYAARSWAAERRAQKSEVSASPEAA
jgi:Gpi18-like mannosyltransferase